MEGTKKPPRAYVPSQPAVKSSQPQVLKSSSEKALTSDFSVQRYDYFVNKQVFSQIFSNFAVASYNNYARKSVLMNKKRKNENQKPDTSGGRGDTDGIVRHAQKLQLSARPAERAANNHFDRWYDTLATQRPDNGAREE